MTQNFRTLDDADVRGKRVLLRVDLNVPMENGKVADATRIERVLPTIREIADKGGKVVLLAHFGRPKGGPDAANSLRPVAAAVSELLGRPVGFAADCIGDAAASAISAMKDGEVLLLENTRFHKGEEKNDPGLCRRTRQAGRLLCQRRFLRRPSRARLHRRRRTSSTGLCRPSDASRARRADARTRRADPTRGGDRRRRKGFDQARSARQPDGKGGHPDHRRRHGEHVSVRPRQERRQIALREGTRRHRAVDSGRGADRPLPNSPPGRCDRRERIQSARPFALRRCRSRRRGRDDPRYRPQIDPRRRGGAGQRENPGLERPVRGFRVAAVSTPPRCRSPRWRRC